MKFRMSYQEFERTYSHLLPWGEAEKQIGRRLDYNNNFDCCLYHDLLVKAVQENNEKMEGKKMTKIELLKMIENTKERSAWGRGVNEYAYKLVENLETNEITTDMHELENLLLNGADSWEEYSWGGCSLIYDCDIAERLCTPSEFKKTKGGERKPNNREEWLDVQARALFQAAHKIYKLAKEA